MLHINNRKKDFSDSFPLYLPISESFIFPLSPPSLDATIPEILFEELELKQ